MAGVMKWLGFVVVIVAVIIGFFLAFPGPATKVTFDLSFKISVFKLKFIDGYAGKDSIESQALTNLFARSSFPSVDDIPAYRSALDNFGHIITVPSDIELQPVTMSVAGRSVSGTWFIPRVLPDDFDKDRVVLYFHGGGLVAGSVFSHSGFTAELARRTRGRVLSVEYRLAPEHPLPAAVEDGVLAYKWLVREQNIPSNKIVIAGDSAGGGLTLLTLLEIPFAEKGTLPRPAAGVTFSAVTDWGDYRPSYTRNRDKDVVVHIDVKHRAMVTATAADDVARRKSPKLSPIYAPLDQIAKLPPLFMSVGTAEVLEDDTVHFAGKAKQAAVDLTLKVYENAQHVTVYFFDYVPEANTALNDVAQFIIKKTTHT